MDLAEIERLAQINYDEDFVNIVARLCDVYCISQIIISVYEL